MTSPGPMEARQSDLMRLRALLAEELAALKVVLDALGAESAALESRDADLLLSASNTKAAAIASATRLEQERRTLTTAHPELTDGTVAASFLELRRLVATCHRQNEANGLLIRGQRRRLEGSLAILRGGRAAAEVYGRDGEPKRSQHSRALASY